MEERVILVDQNDHPIGMMEKLEAHREGKLHRAFSIFVVNSRGELLIQKRAKTKYHSGGLWTNACDGHPRPGEDIEKAARRRLREELGFDCDLAEAFQFTYQVEIDHGLQEHEVDHILIGHFDGQPSPDPAEASECKWITWDRLENDMASHPDQYASWFKIALTYKEQLI